MESSLLSVSKIFTEKLLRIPDYQRGYAWSIKEVSEYWGDLIHLEPNKGHYVGVITLEDAPEDKVKGWHDDQWIILGKSYKPYFVVDGQQRLTTTIILIQAIIEVVEDTFDSDELVLNYDEIDEIRKQYIFRSKDKGVSRSYIFGYEKDNPSYEYLKRNIFCEQSNNSGQIQETIYTSNLEAAKNYFITELKGKTKEEIESIYKKVTQYFLFNIYSLDKEIDTYVAFETMNNRGKGLSHLELLKNRLIYLTTQLDDDDYEKQSLRHSINECWKSIYHYLGKSKDNPLDDDEFLYSHFSLYFDKSETSPIELSFFHRHGIRQSFKSVLLESIFSQNSLRDDETKKVVTIQYIHDYVMNLKESVEHWYQIFNPLSSDLPEVIKEWLERIQRIRNWQSSASLILAFFRLNSDENLRLQFLMNLERMIFIEFYLFRQHLSMFNRGELLSLAKSINSKKIEGRELISVITSKTDTVLKDYRELWSSGFKDGNFYDWPGVRYVLFEYELDLKRRSKDHRTKLVWSEFSKYEPWEDYKTVEHIFPQRPQSKYWKDRFGSLSTDHRKRLRHNIGNLVPLSKQKNSRLSNKPFPDKAEIGYAYGCYSENEISRKHDWTPEEIRDKSIKMIKFIDKRWKLGISHAFNGQDPYLNFSGLLFMKNK